MRLGILLMAGLYFTFSMSLVQTQASRDALEIEDVSRAVFNKISVDLNGILGPSAPNSGGTAPSGASSGTSNSSNSSNSTPTGTGGSSGDMSSGDMTTGGSTTGGTSTAS